MNLFQPLLPQSILQRLRTLEEELLQKIYADTKTPLQNFEAFEALWPQLISVSPSHLLFVEVDEMKRLNNEFGHDTADRFLEELGKVLRGLCSEQVYAFHMSGDEFLVTTCGLLPKKVEDLAVRILRETRQCRVLIADREENFTVSIGIAEISLKDELSKPSRDMAEDAMKEAKRKGRNQYIWHTTISEQQPVRIDYRKDCPNCSTHFSFTVDEAIYRRAESFHCPVCGKSIAR